MRDDLKNHIEKYLRSELSASEMHALEKRALDDPFLADALEGATQLDASQFSSDINALSEKIIRRSQKKVIPMWVWPARIAAGLVLIVLSMYVINNLVRKDETSLALSEAKKAESAPPEEKEELKSTDPVPSSVEETTRDADDNKGDNANLTAPKVQSQARTSKPAVPEQEQLLDRSDTDEDLIAKQEDQGPQKEVASGAAREKITADTIKGFLSLDKAPVPASPQPVIEAKDEATDRSKRKADTRVAASKSIEGRVSDVQVIPVKKVIGRVTFSEDSTGLPGVNVVIKGTNTGTVTDMNGNYQIDLTDTNATLVYSFIGLESKEVPVENKSSINVPMDQDVAQLSEVVVTGYGEGENDEEKIYSTFEMAAPAGGRRAFKKYLEDKLVYPQLALDNKIEGRVTVQFTVETSGKLTDFNVLKGIGYGCDDEVIRLIKKGPKWTATKRNDEPVKGKVKVRMRFSLPKKK